MTDHLSTAKAGVDVAFSLPDAATFGSGAIADALAMCASKMHLLSSESALDCLRDGDEVAWDFFEYGIARQVAEHLGAMDREVRRIYSFDDEATPEDAAFSRHSGRIVHLIVEVERRTGALHSLIAAVDRSIVQACSEVLNRQGLQHMLDVQVVDEADVRNRNGYGALLASIHHRPMRIWER